MKWKDGKCEVCGCIFSVPQKFIIEGIVQCPQCNSVSEVKKINLNYLSLPLNGQRKKKKRGGGYINGGPLKFRR